MSHPLDILLDRLHGKADPVADEVVADLFRTGQVARINDALDHLSGNAQELPAGLPARLSEYLGSTAVLPPDADPDRIRRAQDAFAAHGVALGVALMYASLPSLYAGALGGVQILAMTGQLKDHYRRRAAETLRFILDVMEPGALEPGGKGIRATQKVRLMHATIRHFARVSGRWAALPEWGAPINQEELLGTLLSFSSLAVDNAARLGSRLSDAEAEDLLHAWGVVGAILGVDPEGIPKRMPEARAIWKRISSRNFAPTPEGRDLARDHVAFLDELVPGQVLSGINLALSRWLMGPDVAARCLGLPRERWWIRLVRLVVPLLGLADRFLESSGPVEKLVEGIHLQLMEGLDRHWAEGKSLPFRLPTAMGPRGTVTEGGGP